MLQLRNRYLLDKIIITAMDRFVWFVLLVVMSHLVTEYTRVIGQNNDASKQPAVTVNDTYFLPRLKVENNILYPSDQRFSADNPQKKQTSMLANIFAASGQQQKPTQQEQHHQQQQQQQQEQVQKQPAQLQNQEGLTNTFFNLRPIIDSIFEIPISTLRAVNNLVTRLTGVGYRTPSTKIPYQHELSDSLNMAPAQVEVKPEKILQLQEKRE